MDTAANADTIAPAAPASVWADTTGGSITLRWSAANTNEEIGGALTDLAGYRIYRSGVPDPSNWGTAVGSTAAGDTDYVDSVAHGHFRYRVTAHDNHSPWENESWYSMTVSALLNNAPTAHAGIDTIVSLTPFALQGNLSGDTDGDTLAYVWTQVSGPDSAGIAGFSTAVATVVSGVVPGTYVFQLTVTDSLGATAADTVTVVAMDSAAPACGSTAVVINSDTPATTTPTVTLSFSSDTLVYQMRVGHDPAFTGSSWETYAASKSWPLGDTNGVRTVYVQFRNYFGIVSAIDSDTIWLDNRVAETVAVQVVNGSGAEITTTANADITLRLSMAPGTDSGGFQYRVSEYPDYFGAAWDSWPAGDTLLFGLSDGGETKTLYIEVMDTYGNVVADSTIIGLLNMPYPVGSFSGLALTGGIVRLTWTVSPSSDRDSYALYWDTGAGAPNYGIIRTIIDAAATQFETGPFAAGDSYVFGIRTINTNGDTEANTNVQVTVVVKADTGALYAVIADPEPGDRVAGNRTLIKADLHGDRTGHTNTRVRLQWRPAAGAWANVSAANANHPNPDYTEPYFVHWDVTALANGQYFLRAIAESDLPYADSQAAEISVTVDRQNPEIFEGIGSDGNQQKKERVNSSETSTVGTEDADDTGSYEVRLPAGALTGNTAVRLVIYEDTRQGYAGANRRQFDTGGAILEITLDNGQTTLNDTVTITIPYSDNNSDSIIDGTRVRLELATILYWNGSIWQAVERGNVRIDPARKVFTAHVRHFSKFATGKTFLGGDLGTGVDDIPDGTVNANDLGKFNTAFGARRGNGNFRDDADIVVTGSSEGRVDEEDLFEIGRTYGTAP